MPVCLTLHAFPTTDGYFVRIMPNCVGRLCLGMGSNGNEEDPTDPRLLVLLVEWFDWSGYWKIMTAFSTLSMRLITAINEAKQFYLFIVS